MVFKVGRAAKQAVYTTHAAPSLSMQPSLLALAVLGCDLKLLGADWLSAVLALQALAHTRGGELSVCYEAIAPHYLVVSAQYPLAFCCSKERVEQGPPLDCPAGLAAPRASSPVEALA